MDDELIKERERICNLDRTALIHEYVDGLSMSEIMYMLHEYMYADDIELCDDTLRHELLESVI